MVVCGGSADWLNVVVAAGGAWLIGWCLGNDEDNNNSNSIEICCHGFASLTLYHTQVFIPKLLMKICVWLRKNMEISVMQK